MPKAFRCLIAPAFLALALGGAAGQPAPEIRFVVLVRRVVLTVRDGLLFDPAAVYATIGVKPAV